MERKRPVLCGQHGGVVNFPVTFSAESFSDLLCEESTGERGWECYIC